MMMEPESKNSGAPCEPQATPMATGFGMTRLDGGRTSATRFVLPFKRKPILSFIEEDSAAAMFHTAADRQTLAKSAGYEKRFHSSSLDSAQADRSGPL